MNLNVPLTIVPNPSAITPLSQTSRCPFLFRAIVKRHAMTGTRLGRCAETGQPPGFGGVGPGPSGNGMAGALSRTAHTPKRSGTCPVRCLVFRLIVKRHAMTGSRLGRYARAGQPPGSGGVGVGPSCFGVAGAPHRRQPNTR
ncbi:MAG: hypothetical protein WCH85_08510 [Methanomicrobiales archaeon]